MASLLSHNVSSGYVLATWALGYAVEHPEEFAQFLNSETPDDIETNAADIIPDLELTKSLLCQMAHLADDVFNGEPITLHATIGIITDGINPPTTPN